MQLSKEDTWGEKELAKHMLKDKKKRPTEAQGWVGGWNEV